MPWKETCAMDQRVQFISDWLSGEYTKYELCEAYGISRPTGDKWIGRYAYQGVEGLAERSRAPQAHPNATPPWICQRIIETKLAHQSWGPKKVIDRLREVDPSTRWPADSTAGQILLRAGLVKPRVHRRRVPPDTQPFGDCRQANHTWSTDFKGDFKLGNGRRCYPLTVSDNYSRFLLQCRALEHPSGAAVRPWFEWVFREYGLPQAMRTDNGAPFASLAVGGLSCLSKWWIQLGIRPERIRPGTPSQNGRHERMHRTLKDAAIQPPRPTMRAQQRQFDRFVQEYNWERSHEALDRKTPGSQYRSSAQPYPTKLRPVEYTSEWTVRQVRHNGEIRWQGDLLYVSEVLAKEPIGLKQIDNALWELRYSFHLLGILDNRTRKIMPPTQWHRVGKPRT